MWVRLGLDYKKACPRGTLLKNFLVASRSYVLYLGQGKPLRAHILSTCEVLFADVNLRKELLQQEWRKASAVHLV